MLEFFRDYLATTGGIHLVSILPDSGGDGVTGRHFGTDYEAAATWALDQNAQQRNIYWTANVVTPGLNKKPTKEDITGVRVAHVDVDPSGSGWDKSAALSDIQLRGTPSVIIDSGNGWQALWWLSETSDIETVERINRGIQHAFKADHCWNIDRLLRVPGGGLINWPDKRKQSLGRVPVPTALHQPFNGVAYAPSALLTRFPANETVAANVSQMLPTGPREDYTGPEDDDELIRMMLRSRGGVSAMFGEKATVADLWEADPATMAKFFPSDSGDDFNRSSADAALLAHLTFWTGNDPARIDRLFRRSGLMRDKWNRESYREISIGKAVAACVNVYSAARELPDQSALQGEILTGGEILNINEQIEYFKGCVYVADRHEVIIPDGQSLKPDRFNAMYGGKIFMIGDSGSEKKAFTAFTENRLHQFPKVATTMFEPLMPFGTIRDNMVNVYRPDPSVSAIPGDVSPFLDHLSRMFPVERDREILLTYLASLVQNPGVKFQWAPFIQGVQGNGKSMIGEILKRAVGPMYVHEPFSDDLANKFNDWLDNKLLIVVEELSLGERVEIENNIKTWVTSRSIEMQAKGGKKSMRPNRSNWIIFSNFQNALPIDANQRRYAPFFTAQQTAEDVARDFSGDYFPKMWEWLNNGGFEHLTHYLRTRSLHPEFDPAGSGAAAARAPETSSTPKAVTASRGRFEQEVLEAVESGKPGFRSPWISSTAVTALVKDLRLRISPVRLRAALESLGYVQWGRSTVVIMAEGGTKPVLYVKKGFEDQGVTDYLISQGFSA